MRKERSCDTNGTDFYPDTEYEPYRGNRDPAGHFSPTFFEETAESFFLSFMGGRAFQIALSDFFLFGGFFARRFENAVHGTGADRLYSRKYRNDGAADGGSAGSSSRRCRKCGPAPSGCGEFCQSDAGHSVHRNVYLDVRYSDHDNICRDRVLKTASEIKDSG